MINELKQQIRDNLIDMDNLLDLMSIKEYKNNNYLDRTFNELQYKTKELQNKLNKLVSYIN